MKLRYILIAAFALLWAGCSDKFDDSNLWKAIDGLEQRMETMETVQKAYENKVLIDKVESTEDGYNITFSDGTQAVIVNDKPIDPSMFETCYIDHIEVDDSEVHFYLSDGTDFIIKMVAAISIHFDDASPVTVMQGQSRILNFSIESELPDVELEVISSGDLKSRLLAYDKESQTGSIRIMVAQEVDEFSKVVLIANNGRRVSMRRLEFSNEGIGIVDNSKKEIASDGGNMELEFVADVPTEIVIPTDAQSWIKVVPSSRALEYNRVLLELAPNTGNTREAYITIRSEDGSLSVVFYIRQKRDVNAVEAAEEDALRILMEHVYKGTDLESALSQPISTWPGVTLTDGHVTGLEFVRALKDEIPCEIGALKYLKSFKVLYGYFQVKAFPEEFGLLENLEEIEIAASGTGNSTEGQFPECIYNLTKLKKIIFSGTSITSIDSRLKQLSDLEYLEVSGNKLTSFDFNALCELKALRHFGCRVNYNLTGQIPKEIGNLKNLENFDIGYCKIDGTLPDAFWTMGNLKVFSVPGNKFPYIQLPASIGAMKNLESLGLSNIPLRGQIPSDIGKLKKLKELLFEGCDLNGEIPAGIAECSRLEHFSLFMNKIEGTIPEGLGNLPLKHLNLAHNKLSGEIPQGLGKLETIWLFDNQLTGKIPDDLVNSGALWRNRWGYVIYQNQLDYNFESMLGPIDLHIYHDVAMYNRYDLSSEYEKHEYTILVAFHKSCPYVEDALKILKDAYSTYSRSQLEVIGWTYIEEPDNKERFEIPWPLYYGPQLDYPCYVTPMITVFNRDGYVVFTDLVHDRFSLPDWLKEHLGN